MQSKADEGRKKEKSTHQIAIPENSGSLHTKDAGNLKEIKKSFPVSLSKIQLLLDVEYGESYL